MTATATKTEQRSKQYDVQRAVGEIKEFCRSLGIELGVLNAVSMAATLYSQRSCVYIVNHTPEFKLHLFPDDNTKTAWVDTPIGYDEELSQQLSDLIKKTESTSGSFFIVAQSVPNS